MGGKQSGIASMTKEQCVARLEEIAKVSLGTLGDEEALAIIKERKELEARRTALEAAEKEAAAEARLASEKADLEASIEELNRSIAPDKSDEELLALIGRRKELEGKLKAIKSGRVPVAKKEEVSVASVVPESEPAEEEAPVAASVPEAPAAEPAIVIESAPSEPEPVSEPVVVAEAPKRHASAGFGEEGIKVNPLEITGEFKQYLDGVQSHVESLGSYLQHLPANAKANKNLMLKIAETDPAYAMHYADASLKSDEDFCIRVAGLPNKRHSGNALAEMDPAGRSGKAVLAGTKQDYRNVRFALPAMPEYRDILEVAKRGALHKIQELKDGADVMLLVPKILQKDQDFMRQVNAVVSPEGK